MSDTIKYITDVIIENARGYLAFDTRYFHKRRNTFARAAY